MVTLLATYDASGNLKQRFEHTLGHTPTSFTQNGQRYFIQTDHLGSPRVITDSSGNIVDTDTPLDSGLFGSAGLGFGANVGAGLTLGYPLLMKPRVQAQEEVRKNGHPKKLK